MSKFETTFRNAVANAERDVLIDQIRSNPQMSLAELGKLAAGDLGSLLKGITIGEILGQEPARAKTGGAKTSRPAAAAPSKPAGRKSSRGKGEKGESKRGKSVDTRTPAGREAFDQSMLSALKASGGNQAAPDLSTVVGGTPLQVRTALARLIERGLVTWTGQARGTRYTAA